MARYFTSDPHLDHAKIISYCGRPFKNVKEMNEVIIKNYKTVLDSGNNLYVLGDFAIARDSKSLRRLTEALGKDFVLVPGNHDNIEKLCEARPSLVNTIVTSCSSRPKVMHGNLLELCPKIKDGGCPYPQAEFYFGISHRPPRVDKGLDKNYAFYLCGHVHETAKWSEKDRWINVGVDAWDFQPQTLKAIAFKYPIIWKWVEEYFSLHADSKLPPVDCFYAKLIPWLKSVWTPKIVQVQGDMEKDKPPHQVPLLQGEELKKALEAGGYTQGGSGPVTAVPHFYSVEVSKTITLPQTMTYIPINLTVDNAAGNGTFGVPQAPFDKVKLDQEFKKALDYITGAKTTPIHDPLVEDDDE